MRSYPTLRRELLMSEKEVLKKRAMDAVDDLKGTLIAMSDKMYREPELGHQEFKSSQMLSKFLEEQGF